MFTGGTIWILTHGHIYSIPLAPGRRSLGDACEAVLVISLKPELGEQEGKVEA